MKWIGTSGPSSLTTHAAILFSSSESSFRVGISSTTISNQVPEPFTRLSDSSTGFIEPSQISLWVRNIGHGDITVTQALVNGTFYDFWDEVIVLPSPVYNPAANATEIVIPGTFDFGVYRISLFTFRGNELGVVEVDYS